MTGLGALTAEVLTVLYETHAKALHRYLARRLDTATADDLVAETFLQAWRERAKYDTARGTARAWLYGIATNLLRNHTRSEVRGLRALAREQRPERPSGRHGRGPCRRRQRRRQARCRARAPACRRARRAAARRARRVHPGGGRGGARHQRRHSADSPASGSPDASQSLGHRGDPPCLTPSTRRSPNYCPSRRR